MIYTNYILKAIDQNILTYDVDAPQGQFTERLICIILNVLRTMKCSSPIKEIVLSSHIDEKTADFLASLGQYGGKEDAKVTVDSRILFIYLKNLGSLQKQDTNLVLFILEDGECLPGSY